MLSLTDLWKANGSDPSRRPAVWLRSVDGQRFVSFMKALEGQSPHFQLIESGRGGRGLGGATFAHWQITLAHAELSPQLWAYVYSPRAVSRERASCRESRV